MGELARSAGDQGDRDLGGGCVGRAERGGSREAAPRRDPGPSAATTPGTQTEAGHADVALLFLIGERDRKCVVHLLCS